MGKTAQANMMQIPGGAFTMGSPKRERMFLFFYRKMSGELLDETQHRVTISPFYMGKYPVTQDEYSAIMFANPSESKGNNNPVERVSWYDAIEYCNKLSLKEGLMPAYTIDKSRKDLNNLNGKQKYLNITVYDDPKWLVIWNRKATGYRLPTEAEWEYACRAGTTTAYNTGKKISRKDAWYDDIDFFFAVLRMGFGIDLHAHPVGEKPPNAWGLYDMHGNVNEWCWDWCGNYPQSPQIAAQTSAQTDPAGPPAGYSRICRGGSYDLRRADLRSACRRSELPNWTRHKIGFRLVRSA